MHRLVCLVVVSIWSTALAAADEFPLRDGDLWVFAGDSITEQHLHTNYFEAFCHARYPQWKFAFRNAGSGGHTVPRTIARFEYDIAAWKPTIVSVELGMNDRGSAPPAKFVEDMKVLIERIRSVHARPVLLSPSPVNNGELTHMLDAMPPMPSPGRNAVLPNGFFGNISLRAYAVSLHKLADEEKIPFADQFHALLDVWGRNKPREDQVNVIQKIREIARDDSLSGVEHLRSFLASQQAKPLQAVSMLGDPVHPGPTGQLMMAAAILKALKAKGFVSSATLEASGRVLKADGCTISDITVENDSLAFDRLDACLPFPIADEARPVLAIAPDVLELSQYSLSVKALPAGDYSLKIEGVPIAKVTAGELAAGINLTNIGAGPKNPITIQGKNILAAVSNRANVVAKWRGVSKTIHESGPMHELKEQLVKLQIEVEQADDEIRRATRPQRLHFKLTR